MSRRLVSLLFVVSLLTSCGFHLRGNYSMPEALSTMTIVGGNRDFVEKLTDRLQNSGSQVVSGQENVTTLKIIKLEYDSTVDKTDDAGRATGYVYTYELDYLVEDGKGEILQPAAALSQKRSQEYDPTEELQAEEEEEFLRDEMEQELILQILRRLSRI